MTTYEWQLFWVISNFAGWVETGIERMAVAETQPAKN